MFENFRQEARLAALIIFGFRAQGSVAEINRLYGASREGIGRQSRTMTLQATTREARKHVASNVVLHFMKAHKKHLVPQTPMVGNRSLRLKGLTNLASFVTCICY